MRAWKRLLPCCRKQHIAGLVKRCLALSAHLNQSHPPTVAIRREDSSVWERRAPLNPAHVHQLVRDGVRVLVQPSSRRAYLMPEYERSGAVITDEIGSADVIMGALLGAVPAHGGRDHDVVLRTAGRDQEASTGVAGSKQDVCILLSHHQSTRGEHAITGCMSREGIYS